jgi:hypothetical protein
MGLVISREGGRFAMTAVPRFSVPVAVIMGRRMVSRSGWRVPGRDSRAVSVHRTEDEEHFLWGGLQLELYRDATEAYWSNLMGQQPSLFVLCAETEDGGLEPQSVTADMHEASSGTEGEDLVFAAPIPPEVYQQLERFVVEHHRPEEKRKRKRTDWNADKPA